MIDLERARNLALMGRDDDALAALDAADHSGLRALALVESAPEFDSIGRSAAFSASTVTSARVLSVRRQSRGERIRLLGRPVGGPLPDGTLIGTNTITKRDGGCSIQERWEGAGGSTGTSVSFYLPSRGEWRQVWTGSGGTLFDITGKSGNGSMQMEGTIEYVETNRVVAFRGTWTEGSDGRVRQRLEEFDLAAQAWVVWFDGFYRRLD